MTYLVQDLFLLTLADASGCSRCSTTPCATRPRGERCASRPPSRAPGACCGRGTLAPASPRGPASRLRALLPRRQGPHPRIRGLGAGARHRQSPRRGLRRPDHRPQRAGRRGSARGPAPPEQGL